MLAAHVLIGEDPADTTSIRIRTSINFMGGGSYPFIAFPDPLFLNYHRYIARSNFVSIIFDVATCAVYLSF